MIMDYSTVMILPMGGIMTMMPPMGGIMNFNTAMIVGLVIQKTSILAALTAILNPV